MDHFRPCLTLEEETEARDALSELPNVTHRVRSRARTRSRSRLLGWALWYIPFREREKSVSVAGPVALTLSWIISRDSDRGVKKSMAWGTSAGFSWKMEYHVLRKKKKKELRYRDFKV